MDALQTMQQQNSAMVHGSPFSNHGHMGCEEGKIPSKSLGPTRFRTHSFTSYSLLRKICVTRSYPAWQAKIYQLNYKKKIDQPKNRIISRSRRPWEKTSFPGDSVD